MKIDGKTKVSAILDRYSDIEPAMEALGIKSVGSWSLRRKIAKFINVELAAKVHRVPVSELIEKLNQAVSGVPARRSEVSR